MTTGYVFATCSALRDRRSSSPADGPTPTSIATLPAVPWRAIAGTRDRLVHAYFEDDLERPRQIVAVDLSPLTVALEGALAPER